MTYLFQPRKSRMSRFDKYAGKIVDLVHTKQDSMMMVTCLETWNPFSAYADELTPILKPIHGSTSSLVLNNDGTIRTYDNDDSK